jgi:hypothetical protein
VALTEREQVVARYRVRIPLDGWREPWFRDWVHWAGYALRVRIPKEKP